MNIKLVLHIVNSKRHEYRRTWIQLCKIIARIALVIAVLSKLKCLFIEGRISMFIYQGNAIRDDPTKNIDVKWANKNDFVTFILPVLLSALLFFFVFLEIYILWINTKRRKYQSSWNNSLKVKFKSRFFSSIIIVHRRHYSCHLHRIELKFFWYSLEGGHFQFS